MSKRISHSLLDPWLTVPVKRGYPRLPLPAWLPPEMIVLGGHLLAVAAAFGFAYSTQYAWGGLVIALGVAGNHIADVLDGTHARMTGQCRNGGELLDHFTDPLSFAYYVVGLAVSVGRLDLGLAGVIVLFATAVLTNIKAKMIGEFTLSTFGPTEFKTLLVAYGLALTALVLANVPELPPQRFALGFMIALLAVGLLQLIVNLIRAVVEVNRRGTPADQTEWQTTRANSQAKKI